MRNRIFILLVFFITAFLPIAKADISLEQKIGQMLMVGFCGTELHDDDPIVQDILAQRVGAVVLYDKYDQTQGICNIENPEQLKKLTQQLQTYALTAAKQHHNHLYPLLIAIDYEGGKVTNLKETAGFPKTLSAADIGNGSVEQAESQAKQMAKTLHKEGVNLDFAPVVDVNLNPNNPVIAKHQRSFSADPSQVVAYARIFSQVFHQHHILCTYKHFPGHGSSEKDSHLGFVDVSHTWKPEELIPYQQLLKDQDSCGLVMTAHIVNHGLDAKDYSASLSYAMTSRLLRQQLGFKGVVVTDDLQMGAVRNYYDLATTVALAANAGADILLFSNQLVKTPQDTAEIVNTIAKEVQEGKIPESRIDESYLRLVKLKAGL